LPLEPVFAWLEIALPEPSNVRPTALTVTVPALPPALVLELITPPLCMSRVLALTVTMPALAPLVVFELMRPPPCISSVSAFTVTMPAFCEPLVSEVMVPPPLTVTSPGVADAALITMLLAATPPVVAPVMLPPSTVSCGAVTLSVVCVGVPIGEVASFLIEKVASPLSSILLSAEMVTLPVCPEEPLAAAR